MNSRRGNSPQKSIMTRKRTASEHSLTSTSSSSPRKKVKTGSSAAAAAVAIAAATIAAAGVRKNSNAFSEERLVVTPDFMVKKGSDALHLEEEPFDAGDEEEEEVEKETANLNVDLSEWDIADLRILVASVEREAPTNETCRFRTSLDKVDWTAVAAGMGGGRSGEECKRALNSIIQQVRTHRTLSEILADAKVVAENPFRNKRTGRINHPDQPKKPPTPYFLFFSEKRAKYQAVNPGMSPTELSSFMAAEFNALSEKKRAKYRKQYDKAMEEYRQKYAEFRRRHPDLFKRNRKPAVTPNDLGVPEKPRKPFYFYQTHRMSQEKYLAMEQKAAVEAIKASWNALSEERRMKWIKKAVKDEKRYEEEMSTYCAEHPNYLRPPPTKKNVSVLTKEEQRLKNKVDGRPERPPTSGYILFSQQMMAELGGVAAKEKVVEIGRRWRELAEEERAKFNAQAVKAQDEYVGRFDAYLKGLPEEERQKVLAEQRLKGHSDRRLMTSAQRATHAQVLASALTYFQTEELMRMQRQQPSKMRGELIGEINRRWEAMTDSERQVYVDLAESIKEYLPAAKQGASVYLKRTRKKTEVNPKEVEFVEKSGRKRPPKNGFTLFMRECGSNPEYASLLPTEKMKQMAAMWKVTFAEYQRQYYVKRCKEMNEAFSALVKKYEETGQLPTPEEAEAVDGGGEANPGSNPATNTTASKKPVLSKSSQQQQQNRQAPPETRARSPVKQNANTNNSTTTTTKPSSPRKTNAAAAAARSSSPSPSSSSSSASVAVSQVYNNTADQFIYQMPDDSDSD